MPLTKGREQMHSALIRRTASQALIQAAYVAIPFPTLVYEVGEVYNSGQLTRLTSPVIGVFNISGVANSIGGSSAMSFRINGTTIVSETTIGTGESGSLSTNFRLNAGDYVELVMFASATSMTTTFAELSIALLGGG